MVKDEEEDDLAGEDVLQEAKIEAWVDADSEIKGKTHFNETAKTVSSESV